MNTTNFHYTPRVTAVPTRLLLAEDLSPEAKLTGAILHAFDDGNQSYHALAAVLNIPPEKIAPAIAELTGNGYLEILEENGGIALHLKG